MDVVIKAVAHADGSPCPYAGQYLFYFDFDADDGRGFGEFTTDITKAMKFGSALEALRFWRRQSSVKPYRDYGNFGPNRPLTALTIEILPVDDMVSR